MNATLQSIEAEALKLTPQERADLADRLWASVHSAEEIEEAWQSEIGRRARDVDDGLVTGRPWTDVMNDLKASPAR